MAIPGQSISISWQDANLGGADASGTWTDRVYLSSDQTIGNDEFLGSFPFTGTIAAGQAMPRTASVTLPMFDQGDHWLVIVTGVGASFFEPNTSNNTSIAGTKTNLLAQLTVMLSAQSVAENAANPATTGSVTRNGDTSSLLPGHAREQQPMRGSRSPPR